MYQIAGRIERIFEEKTISDNFRIKEFVVNTLGTHPQSIIFQCNNANIVQLNDLEAGEDIIVEFLIKGKENKSKYFVNLIAENILPEASSELCRLELTDDLKKDFLVSCRQETNSSLPKDLEDLNAERINELWEAEFEYANYPREVFNFRKADNSYLFSHRYYEKWGKSESQGLVALAKYGLQWIDILSSKGKLLFENANDVTFQKNGLIHIQKQDMTDWIAFYHEGEKILHILFQLKEMPLEEVKFVNGVFDNGGELVRLSDFEVELF